MESYSSTPIKQTSEKESIQRTLGGSQNNCGLFKRRIGLLNLKKLCAHHRCHYLWYLLRLEESGYVKSGWHEKGTEVNGRRPVVPLHFVKPLGCQRFSDDELTTVKSIIDSFGDLSSIDWW